LLIELSNWNIDDSTFENALFSLSWVPHVKNVVIILVFLGFFKIVERSVVVLNDIFVVPFANIEVIVSLDIEISDTDQSFDSIFDDLFVSQNQVVMFGVEKKSNKVGERSIVTNVVGSFDNTFEVVFSIASDINDMSVWLSELGFELSHT
jgi:hypothetical protein